MSVAHPGRSWTPPGNRLAARARPSAAVMGGPCPAGCWFTDEQPAINTTDTRAKSVARMGMRKRVMPAVGFLDEQNKSSRRTWLRAAGPVQNFFQFIGLDGFQLVIGAIARRLVAPPAQEHRRVPEAPALQVVILHLAHAAGLQRFPGQVFAAIP